MLTHQSTINQVCNTSQPYATTRQQQTISKSVFYVEDVSAPDGDLNLSLKISLSLPLNGRVSDICEQKENKFHLGPEKLIVLELNANGFNRILTGTDSVNQQKRSSLFEMEAVGELE